jgi:hypothetical protein
MLTKSTIYIINILIYTHAHIYIYIYIYIYGARGSVVVKYYATNRKIAGSTPDEVIF